MYSTSSKRQPSPIYDSNSEMWEGKKGSNYESTESFRAETRKSKNGTEYLSVKGGEDDIINSKPVDNQSTTEELLDRINKYLNNWSSISNTDFDPNNFDNDLHVNGKSINYLCMLHHMSKDPNFLSKHPKNEGCQASLRDIMTDGKVNLSKLINESSINDESFQANTDFYNRLYKFNIAMAKFISSDNEFKNASPTVKKNILNGMRKFVHQSIVYSQEYMNKHNIIDRNLIDSNYDLMYLLNILSVYQANTGKTVEDLSKLYNTVVKAVSDNIRLFQSIRDSGFTETQSEVPLSQIDNMYAELNKRLDSVNKIHTELIENKEAIDENTASLADYVSDNVLNIGESIKSNNTRSPTKSVNRS